MSFNNFWQRLVDFTLLWSAQCSFTNMFTKKSSYSSPLGPFAAFKMTSGRGIEALFLAVPLLIAQIFRIKCGIEYSR